MRKKSVVFVLCFILISIFLLGGVYGSELPECFEVASCSSCSGENWACDCGDSSMDCMCCYEGGGGSSECDCAGCTICDESCTDTSNSPNNCGSCGNVCSGGDGICEYPKCTGGICGIGFSSSTLSCGSCGDYADSGVGQTTYYDYPRYNSNLKSPAGTCDGSGNCVLFGTGLYFEGVGCQVKSETCSALKECHSATYNINGGYLEICHRTNQGQWQWDIDMEAETNCSDGYDNDCDGNKDGTDESCDNPNCAGKECGDDGYGASCGTCVSVGEECINNQCVKKGCAGSSTTECEGVVYLDGSCMDPIIHPDYIVCDETLRFACGDNWEFWCYTCSQVLDCPDLTESQCSNVPGCSWGWLCDSAEDCPYDYLCIGGVCACQTTCANPSTLCADEIYDNGCGGTCEATLEPDCGSRVCGPAPNGCGGKFACGWICEEGLFCDLDGQCVGSNCPTCESCEGFFSECGYQECHSCEGGNYCYYRGEIVGGNDCIDVGDACSTYVSECSDYSSEECENNVCGLDFGCKLEDTECVEELYCGDLICNGDETYISCPSDCEEPRAYWSADQYGTGEITTIDASLDETKIYLILENSGLTSGTFDFNIYEKDLWPNPDDLIRTVIANIGADGKAIATWIMTQADIDATGENDFDDFYFKEETNNVQSGDLTITVGGFICIGIESCRDATNEGDCTTCDGLNSEVANKSVFDNHKINCDGINYDCSCYWDGDSCEAEYMPIAPDNPHGLSHLGKCQSSENSEDDCEDGLLSYSWTSTWTWDDLNNNLNIMTVPEDYVSNPNPESALHFDPIDETTGKRKNEGCVGGSNTVVCPAQIQLPFFTTYSLVIAIVLIVLIYFLILKNSKKKIKKKKVGKRKRK